jgi:hypothetical protein
MVLFIQTSLINQFINSKRCGSDTGPQLPEYVNIVYASFLSDLHQAAFDKGRHDIETGMTATLQLMRELKLDGMRLSLEALRDMGDSSLGLEILVVSFAHGGTLCLL